MGYTHYWKQHRSFTTEEWNGIFSGASKIIEEAEAQGIKIVDAYGNPDTKPLLDVNDSIIFNGENSEYQGRCETFCLTPHKQDFSFCKTRQYPYDSVVVQILKLARDIAGDAIELSSDGENVFA